MKTFLIRRAKEHEAETVISLIDRAARWLQTRGTDQWQDPWPSSAGRAKRVTDDINSDKTWIVWDGDIAAATITIEYKQNPNLPKLWTWEDDGPGVSVHRVVVDRRYAGMRLGAALFSWAGNQAAACGAKWIRIDVWTTNMELRRYYRRQGFKFVRYHNDRAYPSGALLQRAISGQPEIAGIEFVTEPNETAADARETRWSGGMTSPGAQCWVKIVMPNVISGRTVLADITALPE